MRKALITSALALAMLVAGTALAGESTETREYRGTGGRCAPGLDGSTCFVLDGSAAQVVIEVEDTSTLAVPFRYAFASSNRQIQSYEWSTPTCSPATVSIPAFKTHLMIKIEDSTTLLTGNPCASVSLATVGTIEAVFS